MNPRFSNEQREILLKAAGLLAREAGLDEATTPSPEARARRSYEVPQTNAAISVLHSAALYKDWSPK